MKIGLALGGGGARGAAHLGVLYELRRLGLKPDLITGTSAGGLIGVMVAAGLELEQVEQEFRKFNVSSLFTLPAPGQAALIGNQKARQLLEKYLGSLQLQNLPIPAAVIAVDLLTHREVVLDEGDVISAVLATTAIPVVAPPIERDGMILVDGGILNNVPFDVARARGATHVIAVDLSRSAPYGTPVEKPDPAWPGLLGRAIAVTQRRPLWQVISAVSDIISANSIRARLALSPPDIMLQPEVGTVGIFDFHRIDEGIEAGREAAKASAPLLQTLVRQRYSI